MNTRLIVPLLVAGVLAFACGPRPHSEASAGAPTPVALSSAAQARLRERRHKHDGEVVSQLVVQHTPEGVRFAMNVENKGEKALEINFPNGQTHDVVVVDSLGRELWRYTKGRMYTQVMRNSALGGGDTMTVDAEWAAPTAHGTLTAIATLNSTNFPQQQRAQFVLR